MILILILILKLYKVHLDKRVLLIWTFNNIFSCIIVWWPSGRTCHETVSLWFDRRNWNPCFCSFFVIIHRNPTPWHSFIRNIFANRSLLCDSAPNERLVHGDMFSLLNEQSYKWAAPLRENGTPPPICLSPVCFRNPLIIHYWWHQSRKSLQTRAPCTVALP